MVGRAPHAKVLAEAQSHAVGPTRNEKVLGSIPTGGSARFNSARWTAGHRTSVARTQIVGWGRDLDVCLRAVSAR